MKQISKDDRILIKYLRISLIFGALSAIAVFLIMTFQFQISISAGIIIFGILFLSIPGYLILPGLIYDDFKTGMTFTMDQMLYYAFVFFTLGIGPTLVYFIKYDPRIKAMLSDEEALNNEN